MAQEIVQYAAGFSLNFDGVKEQLNKVNQDVQKVLKEIFSSAKPLIGYGIKKAIDFESIKQQLSNLFQDKIVGETVFGQLREFSEQSHIALDSLGKMTTSLVGMGVATKDNVIENMRMLGDLAFGNREKMQGLAVVMGQVKAQGKLIGNDIYQFINAGVPIWALLEKSTGKTKTELQNMGVTFEQVNKAMNQATSSGGMFFGAMQSASATTSEEIAALKANFDVMVVNIAEAVMPAFNAIVSILSSAAKWFNSLSDGTKQAVGYLLQFAALAGPIYKLVSIFSSITTAVRTLSVALNSNGLTALLSLAAVVATAGVTSFLNYRAETKDPRYQEWLKSEEGRAYEKKYKNSGIFDYMSQTIIGYREKTPLEYYKELKKKQDEENRKQIEKSLIQDKNAMMNRKIDQNINIKLTGDVKTDSSYISKVISDVLNNESDMAAVMRSQKRMELGLTE